MSAADVQSEAERRPGARRGPSGRAWTGCLAGVLVAAWSAAAWGQSSLFPRYYGPVEPVWMQNGWGPGGWGNGPGAGFGTGWSGGGYEHWQYGYGFPEFSDYRLDVPYPPGVPGVPFHQPGRVLVYPDNGRSAGYPMVLPGWLGPVEVQPAWPPAHAAPQAVPRQEVVPAPAPERPAAPRPRAPERVPGDEELAPPALPNEPAPAEALPPPPPVNGQ